MEKRADLCIATPATEDEADISAALASVARLHARSLSHLFRDEHHPALDDAMAFGGRTYAEVLDDAAVLLLGAWRGPQLAGALMAGWRTVPDGGPLVPRRYLYISALVVLPEFRRRGVARALLEETERRALEGGARDIELDVWAFNTSAKEFYERRGYEMERVMTRRRLDLPT